MCFLISIFDYSYYQSQQRRQDSRHLRYDLFRKLILVFSASFASSPDENYFLVFDPLKGFSTLQENKTDLKTNKKKPTHNPNQANLASDRESGTLMYLFIC